MLDGPHVAPVPLRVALLGLGTVGREVARGLLTCGSRLEQAANGREVRLVAVADREPARFEGLDLRDVERVDDGARLIGRPEIDVVVELIGGVETAGRLVAAALEAGHAVVTANKALLARHGADLERLARAHGTALRFEAAVGGAIPVLAPLAGDLAANRIDAVRGILNGSTNYVLTSMTEDGAAYEDVVAQAKTLGFLEADPRVDLEGRDAADKLAVLIRLAFGVWPDVTAIRRAPPALDGRAQDHAKDHAKGDGPPGVTGVTAALIEAARRENLVIKLVAYAARGEDGRSAAWVLPVAVPAHDPLARTDGPENRIEIVGEPVGRVAFVGQGAGGAPTSSAVLGDLLAIARGEGSTWAGLPQAPTLAPDRLVDGMDAPRRWLTCDQTGGGGDKGGNADNGGGADNGGNADTGGGAITDRATIDELRARLGAARPGAVLFPVLEGS